MICKSLAFNRLFFDHSDLHGINIFDKVINRQRAKGLALASRTEALSPFKENQSCKEAAGNPPLYHTSVDQDPT
jgi:hypothetical protein